MNTCDPVTIGIVSISDRASSGAYEDKGLPALQEWLGRALKNPIRFEPRLIPDRRRAPARVARRCAYGSAPANPGASRHTKRGSLLHADPGSRLLAD